MFVVMLGPPGAGKGTQATLLARKLDIPHISTGDMLRGSVKAGTELGETASQYMDAGELVPDEVVIGITRERLEAPDAQEGFVLDGFPRTVEQAEQLDGILSDLDMQLQVVINLEVPERELIRRMTGRRVCPDCDENYHLVFNPPRSLGTCDQCGADLVQREDDKESTVKQRLSVYSKQTKPLVQYYENQGMLVNLDGTGTVEQVHERLMEALE